MYKCAIVAVSGGRARGHAAAYRHITRGKLVAVSTRQRDKLDEFGDTFDVDARYTDYREMFEKEKPDLVHLNTPPDVRLEVFEAAEAAGIPAIIVEKPLAIQDLYGDYFRVDPLNKFATGDRLLPTESSLCNTWHVRFLSGGAFDGGTRLRFLVPEFEGHSWRVTARVFDEQGLERTTTAIESTKQSHQISVDSLNLGLSYGAIEWTFANGVRGHLSTVIEALDKFSVGFEAECRD